MKAWNWIVRLICIIRGHKWEDRDGWIRICGVYEVVGTKPEYREYIVCKRCGASVLNPKPMLKPYTADEEGTMILGWVVEPEEGVDSNAYDPTQM